MRTAKSSWLFIATIFFTLIVCGASLAALFGEVAWWLDLFAHFHLHLLAASCFAFIGSFLARSKISSIISLLAVLINLGALYPNLVAEKPRLNEDKIVMLAWNLFWKNSRHDEAIQYIKDVNADIVVLAETTPEWFNSLSALSEFYPYVHHVPTCDDVGCEMTLLSKTPWLFVESRKFVPDTPPVIAAKFQFPNTSSDFMVFAVHLRKAISPNGARKQFDQIESLGAYTRSFEGPRLVIGDLNAAPQSAAFERLIFATGLKQADLRRQATWLTQFGFFGLAIDHLLISEDMKASITTAPSLGSDHKPIIAEINIH